VSLADHVVLVGHGRVGKFISRKLVASRTPFLVIDTEKNQVADLQREGLPVVLGNAADPEVAAAANIRAARCLLVAIPDAFESGQIVEQARGINPDLPIIVRAHSGAQEEHVVKHGATRVVMGEQEIARAMVATVPGSPREPVLSSVEEADEIASGDGGARPHERGAAPLSQVLGPEAHADDPGRKAPEQGQAGQHAQEPRR
jgi:CPA2 family monovalent cation:H+ antiporter-2